jgi:hypothetical protein
MSSGRSSKGPHEQTHSFFNLWLNIPLQKH